MYEIALTVAACRRADTRVDVAWLGDAKGFGDRDPSEAVALTPGGGRVGALLAGGLDDQLADVAGRVGDRGRCVTLEMADYEAAVVGLAAGGTARCLVVEDTVTGVTAGVAAGATVVGYSPSSVGHSSPEALRAAGAVQVIADMALLPALLA